MCTHTIYKNFHSIVIRYLDVFPRGFSTSFEFAAFQFQVQIIPHITGHDHVGEPKFFR